MCGICGWVDWRSEADEAVVRRMIARLAHRGPDGEGFWRDPTGVAALGHRRLGVLDPTPRADQPMVHGSGAVLVYNGEVYSFPEIRAGLEAEGVSFASSGDTEVVLAALVRHGAQALERWIGMFAFALWDPTRRRLLLARDRLGIKPLFWAPLAHGLAFASEVPALLAHPAVNRSVTREGVARWLQLGYTAGEETLLEGVRRLPPGHLLEADEAGIRVAPWYDLAERVAGRHGQGPAALGEAAEQLEGLLRDAVRIRLVSDVPLGCFLSGGVDSTAVVAAAVAEGALPETVTVRFAGGEDESLVAASTARHLALRNRVELCTPEEMLGLVERWAEVGGDPLADPSLAPTWVVSRAARRALTVALSGDGGDELLSGYPRLRFMPRMERLLGLPPAARRTLALPLPARRWAAKLGAALGAGSPLEAYQAMQGVWPAAEAARLLGLAAAPPAWPVTLTARAAEFPPWTRWRMLDALTFLPERVLAKVDRASMDHGLEVRVPLLDHRIVELLLGLPAGLARGKGVLRAVLDRLGVPQPPRRKRGFEVPLAAWLRGPLREPLERDLFGDLTRDLGLDHELLRTVWESHLAGRADHSERLFAVAVLARWARRLG